MAQHDMKSATQTYSGFIALAKWGAVAGALAAGLVLILIS